MISSLQRLLLRLSATFSQDSADRQLNSEIAAHLEMATQENMRRGLPYDEARREAMARFGGISQTKEEHRDARSLPAFELFMQDLRFALRTFRRDRGFTLVAVLILALGIGANIAVFSVVNTLLLRPLPFPDAQRLAWLAGGHGQGGLSYVTYTVDVYEEFLRHNRSFQDVTAYNPYFGNSDFKITGRGEPQPVSGLMVAGNFFTTLGVKALHGRLFAPEECRRGGRPAVLLSYFFWQRQFAADPGIVGQAIILNDRPYTVVGILPADFDFGAVFWPGLRMDVFVPAILDEMRNWGNTLAVVGRLKPGVTVRQAQAEANILLPQLRRAHPEWFMEYTADISELKDYVSGKLRRSLFVLWCAVGLILLIVCVNLSNLLLARAASRSKEFAMRRALGAGRLRLVRQFLTESLLLASAGAALGLAMAYGTVRYLSHQESIALPLLSRISIDGQAFGWTLLTALATGVVFGLAPSLKVSAGNIHESIRDSGQGVSTGRKHERLRAVLVVSEVALACVLLVAAGLLFRSFLRVLDVDLGFQPSRAAAIKVDYNDAGKAERRAAILQEILRRVRSIPGVQSVGIADMLPLERNRDWGLQAKGRTYRPGEVQSALVRIVTPGYFTAMGMHLRTGRDFGWQDTPSRQPVVIINETAARYHWPGVNPVGRLALVNGVDTPVIGVIADVRQHSLEESTAPEMYLPITQADPEGAELVIRTPLPTGSLASAVIRTLREMNPEQPAGELRPLEQLVDHAVSPRRFFAVLVTAFAALGLVLASLGIYGVISYSVSRQRQEIGIRMALGASADRVQLGVLAQTLRLASVGVGMGLLISLAAGKWINSLLFGTTPADVVVFGAMALLLIAVALLAGYLPARRASRTDPMIALRGD
ncbi:MAG: ABC transporter permease [Bryobacteraceae bacterium]